MPSGNDTSPSGSRSTSGACRPGLDGGVHEHRQTFQILRTDDHVNGTRPFQNLRSLLLRHAPGHCDDRPLAGFELPLMEIRRDA